MDAAFEAPGTIPFGLFISDLLVTVIADIELVVLVSTVFYHFGGLLTSLSLVKDLAELGFAQRASVLVVRAPGIDALEAELVVATIDPCSCLVLELFHADNTGLGSPLVITLLQGLDILADGMPDEAPDTPRSN